MMRELQQGLSPMSVRFLLSIIAAEPDWPLLGVLLRQGDLAAV